MSIDLRKYQSGTHYGSDPLSRRIFGDLYLSARCPVCCAAKGAQCRNKQGLAGPKVHVQRAAAVSGVKR